MANPANYDAALSAINHAIDLSSGNPRLRAEIFLQRAVLHLRAKKFDEALADAETAEALGAIDLDAIFLVEGVTLSLHEDPKDLRQAVRLLTLADQIESPVDPFDYRIIVLYSRCSAYYKLGEFRETVADAHRLLAILPANAHAVQTTYKLLTVSYLRLGEYKSAQSTAIEYANRIGGPEARQWLDIVNYYPKNPQLALNELVRVISSP